VAEPRQVVKAILETPTGTDIDLPAEFDELKAALSSAVEAAIDSGTATGGSNTTIVDTSKSWAANMWVDATFEVTIGAVHYLGIVVSNTADTITISALAGGAAVIAGCEYSLKRPVDIADISDRVARELGVIDSLRKWGGTALTGRDVSLDLANLDIALSALRDALRGAGTKDFTTLEADVEAVLAQLDTVLSTRASEATLSTRATESTLVKAIPIAKAAIFNTALPAAEANWLGADITPTNSPSYLRIYVCVSVAGVLRVARTQGATTVTENLNGGTNLTAGAAYMFDVPWRSGDSINIKYSVTTGTIYRLIIDEIGAAV
jgi:hypothetical protein